MGVTRRLYHPALVELWEWRLAPGERYEAAADPPDLHELLHVLAGEVTVTVAGADHRVAAGQTIGYPAGRVRELRNDGVRPARLLMVEVTPGRGGSVDQ
jgi:quercetin dioxygenase-like cupin family protein